MSKTGYLYRALALVKLMVMLEPRLGGQQQRYLSRTVLWLIVAMFVVVVVSAKGHSPCLWDRLVVRWRQGMMM